jgi:hypothetical protein
MWILFLLFLVVKGIVEATHAPFASQFETNFVKKQDDVLTLFVILLAQYNPDPAFDWEMALFTSISGIIKNN